MLTVLSRYVSSGRLQRHSTLRSDMDEDDESLRDDAGDTWHICTYRGRDAYHRLGTRNTVPGYWVGARTDWCFNTSTYSAHYDFRVTTRMERGQNHGYRGNTAEARCKRCLRCDVERAHYSSLQAAGSEM
jgi:hypothetical protein